MTTSTSTSIDPQSPAANRAPVVREHVAKTWVSYATGKHDRTTFAWLADETAFDGGITLVAQVAGLGAAKAVGEFAGARRIGVSYKGDQPPTLDFRTEGRVECFFRFEGVWVRLWAQEDPADLWLPTPSLYSAAAPVSMEDDQVLVLGEPLPVRPLPRFTGPATQNQDQGKERGGQNSPAAGAEEGQRAGFWGRAFARFGQAAR